jgi:hypothetical protein
MVSSEVGVPEGKVRYKLRGNDPQVKRIGKLFGMSSEEEEKKVEGQ